MGVAAQIDVLYEVTNRFHEQVPVTSEQPPLQTSSQNQPPELKTEHVEYTSLGVAVFEGWLDEGEAGSSRSEDAEGGSGLRWKVPLMREPIEFPMTVSAIRTVLQPSEETSHETKETLPDKKGEEKNIN